MSEQWNNNVRRSKESLGMDGEQSRVFELDASDEYLVSAIRIETVLREYRLNFCDGRWRQIVRKQPKFGSFACKCAQARECREMNANSEDVLGLFEVQKY